MRMNCYSIKDEQTGYRYPMISGSDGDMRRSFIIECKNPDSLIHQALKDFSVWKIGEWDTDTGEFISLPEKILIERGENIIDSL